ncbi:MAG: ExbD/TolR family protein [Desulfuromonas sp.]|jgi:biopolymer transport protein ExbD|nr:biopolymer transporter ExbD [Desulfuromonas thiophila]MDD3802375.1 biopolymer transporter ExbD [Desulfuromonas thiophila]
MIRITAQRRAQRQGLELNIAPLIDMVFILLIFFLVTTHFVRETGVEIARPTAATASPRERVSLLIGVTRERRLVLEGETVDLARVRTAVERLLLENPQAAVVIVADRDSPTGLALEVLDACRLAGAEDVALAAAEGRP